MRIAAPTALQPAARPDAARIDEAARQFEGVFARMLIRSMRDASFGDALFPGENRLYRDLYDQRLATSLTAGGGLGLAPVIARQLGGGGDGAPALDPRLPAPRPAPATAAMATPPGTFPAGPPGHAGATAGAASRSPMDVLVQALRARAQAGSAPPAAPAPAARGDAGTAGFEPRSPEGFVASIWSHAQAAARELGVDARALVAQAALETGWGRRAIQRSDGGTAHNLFGIKATGWNGERAAATTHEYRDGVRRSERAEFRAYGSPAESFADYVRLLKRNPRYRQALGAGADVRRFATALQRAGYATDPSYADKISAIANGPTLDRALSAIGRLARDAGEAAAPPVRAVARAAGAVGRTLNR